MQLLHAAFNPLLILLTFLFAHASTQTTVCGALPILDSCLASTTQIANSCPSTDYRCLCDKWTEVVKCFLQCPSDIRQAAPNAYQSTYCSNAEVYGTTTLAAISKPVSAVSAPSSPIAPGQSSTPDSENEQNDSSSTAASAAKSSSSTSTGAAPSAKQTTNRAAGRFEFNIAGGILIGVALAVGIFL